MIRVVSLCLAGLAFFGLASFGYLYWNENSGVPGRIEDIVNLPDFTVEPREGFDGHYRILMPSGRPIPLGTIIGELISECDTTDGVTLDLWNNKGGESYVELAGERIESGERFDSFNIEVAELSQLDVVSTGRFTIEISPQPVSCTPQTDGRLHISSFPASKRDSVKIERVLKRIKDGEAKTSDLKHVCGDWVDNYGKLLTIFKQNGYTVRSLKYAMGTSDIPGDNVKYVNMRHDVHHRDILGSACMMWLEDSMGVQGHYSVLRYYSPYEQSRDADFDLLRGSGIRGADYGLHGSPVDRYYIEKHCDETMSVRDCNDVAVAAALSEFEAILDASPDVDLPALMEDPQFGMTVFLRDAIPNLRPVIDASIDLVKQDIDTLERRFGETTLYSAHGGMFAKAGCDVKRSEKTDDELLVYDLLCLTGQSHRLLNFKQHDLPLEVYQDRYSDQSEVGRLYLSDSRSEGFVERMEEILESDRDFDVLIHPNVWHEDRIDLSDYGL